MDRRVLQLRLWLRLDVEDVAGDEIEVGEAAPVGRDDGAVLRLERRGVGVEADGGKVEQDLAHLRGGVLDGAAAVLDRLAAGREALVGGAGGVGGDQVDRLERHLELIGGDLGQRRLDPLPKLGLAGEDGDSVAIDLDPGVEEGRLLQAARQLRRVVGEGALRRHHGK